EGAARRYDINREAQDRFALTSHQKAVAAQWEGRFADELAPLTVTAGRETRVVDADEGPRPDSSLDQPGDLRPAFATTGSVTAGNSRSLNDGAAARLL